VPGHTNEPEAHAAENLAARYRSYRAAHYEDLCVHAAAHPGDPVPPQGLPSWRRRAALVSTDMWGADAAILRAVVADTAEAARATALLDIIWHARGFYDGCHVLIARAHGLSLHLRKQQQQRRPATSATSAAPAEDAGGGGSSGGFNATTATARAHREEEEVRARYGAPGGPPDDPAFAQPARGEAADTLRACGVLAGVQFDTMVSAAIRWQVRAPLLRAAFHTSLAPL
jgi:hypothetical protein